MSTLLIKVMMILHLNIKDLLKFRFDNSRKKKYTKRHFSSFTQKNIVIYFLWKARLSKSVFKSRAYFIKLSTYKKVLCFAKTQFSVKKIKSFCSVFPFVLWLKKLQHWSGKKFTCDTNQQKIFTNLSQSLLLLGPSHTNLFEKVWQVL